MLYIQLMDLLTKTDTSVPLERVDEVNELKTYYKQFYTVLIKKVFEKQDQPIITPKLPLEDVYENASKALNLKHVTDTNGNPILEVDNDNRQIILDGLVYKDFKLDETDNTIMFIEHESLNDVDLAMRISKSGGEIEVENWTNPSAWLSLPEYLDKLMTKYTNHVVLDNKLLAEKRSYWTTHYTNVKRLVLDLDNVFTTREYYNV